MYQLDFLKCKPVSEHKSPGRAPLVKVPTSFLNMFSHLVFCGWKIASFFPIWAFAKTSCGTLEHQKTLTCTEGLKGVKMSSTGSFILFTNICLLVFGYSSMQQSTNHSFYGSDLSSLYSWSSKPEQHATLTASSPELRHSSTTADTSHSDYKWIHN